MNKEIAVIITNTVQRNVEKLLTEKGIGCVGIEASDKKSIKNVFKECSKIVLPFPATRYNLSFISEDEALSDFFLPEHTVIGGLIKNGVKEELEPIGVKFYDYFENEAYVLKNAQLTVQGALRLLLESTGDFLVGKKVLITGFGRIGKHLALMLKNLGMKVFVAVRREEAAVEALAYGFEVFSLKTLSGTLFYYDFIFNTVPEKLFSYTDISHLNDSSIYFELASSPFGADKKDFELLGKRYVHGGALPGRFYPEAVACNIAGFIINTGR